MNPVTFVGVLLALMFGMVAGKNMFLVGHYVVPKDEYVCTQTELVKEEPTCVQYSAREK